MTPRDLVFIDTETTGLDPRKHEIIEIAAIRTNYTADTVLGTFAVKVRPVRLQDADFDALRINGYSAEAWAEAVSCQGALIALIPLIQDAVVVGHNVYFDLGFLDAAARAHNMTIPWYKYKIDTASLSWPLAVKGHIETPSLERVETFFGMTRSERHRALADTQACMKVYRALCELYMNKQ